ncbi:MAG: 5-(carboxyamino)imidazole ribonucleotide mutase [bacterium]|jgi:5-(carboxyamino)imidazole ribonucleotide mutase
MSKLKAFTKSSKKAPLVAVIMGSASDAPRMKAAWEILEEFKIPYLKKVVSAHRTPKEMYDFATQAQSKGFRVIIAGAGGAAHLPGMVASLTTLPVIGVPVSITKLDGMDSLLSIVQMPAGIPVATVAIDNSHNAGLLAVKILASDNHALTQKLSRYQEKLRKKVLKMKV